MWTLLRNEKEQQSDAWRAICCAASRPGKRLSAADLTKATEEPQKPKLEIVPATKAEAEAEVDAEAVVGAEVAVPPRASPFGVSCEQASHARHQQR